MDKAVVEILFRTEIGAMAKCHVLIQDDVIVTQQSIFMAIATGEFEILPTDISRQHLGKNPSSEKFDVLKFHFAGAEYTQIHFDRNIQLLGYICSIDIPETEEQAYLLEGIALEMI